MHPAVLDWVGRWVTPQGDPLVVLDVGGRDINGNPEHLFPTGSTWEVVDLHAGPRVTWVGDFLAYPAARFDAALYLEVAEHTADWPDHVARCAELLHPRHGLFVFTAAGPARAPHSAIDGGPLRDGEHYENVHPDALGGVLDGLFNHHLVDVTPDGVDVRAAAWR